MNQPQIQHAARLAASVSPSCSAKRSGLPDPAPGGLRFPESELRRTPTDSHSTQNSPSDLPAAPDALVLDTHTPEPRPIARARRAPSAA